MKMCDMSGSLANYERQYLYFICLPVFIGLLIMIMVGQQTTDNKEVHLPIMQKISQDIKSLTYKDQKFSGLQLNMY